MGNRYRAGVGRKAGPSFTVAPTNVTGSAGGTVQFLATDPNGDSLTYSLESPTDSSYTINSTSGVVTIGNSSGNIYVKVEDSTYRVARATCSVIVQSASALTHGALYTFTGSGFGTRGDYNLDNYTWNGYRHIHAIWQDYSLGQNGYGFSQTGSYANSSLQNGGPSKSGKYWHAVESSTPFNVSQTSGRTLANDARIPANFDNAFICWKQRNPTSVANGKAFRFHSLQGWDWYVGGDGSSVAAVREPLDPPSWPYVINTYGNTGVGTNAWGRIAIYAKADDTDAGACRIWVNESPVTFDNSYMNPSLTLPLVRTTDFFRTAVVTWPNSVGLQNGEPLTQQLDSTDCYFDCTAARVEITGSNGKTEIQPVNVWTNNSITIIVNQGEMATGAATLRVYDANNTVIATKSVIVATSVGFTNSAPFSVTTTGALTHGNAVVVTRSSGSWAARPYGAASWLWDTIGQRWLGGEERNPTYVNNQLWVPDSVWLNQPFSGAGSGGSDDQFRYRTDRSLRHAFQSVLLSKVGGTSEDVRKACIGIPAWPTGWPTKNNKTLFLSYHMKLKNAYDGAANSIKQLRVDDPQGTGTGNGPIISNGGLGFIQVGNGLDPNPHAANNWYSDGRPDSTSWHRHEIYADATKNWFYYWYNNKYNRGGYSGLNGDYEIAPAADWLGWVAQAPRNDVYMQMPNYSGMAPYMIGWDAGSSFANNLGQAIDLCDIYVDPHLERFEISDSATWNVGPTATATREIQGRWSRDSSTQCTVYLNQGAFSTLSGKHLWYVTGRSTAEYIGSFV